MTLTCSGVVALQLEKVKQMLPRMFPTKTVKALAHYRYAWDKRWRPFPRTEFVIADGIYEWFEGSSAKDLVRELVQRALRRYHWVDRGGRVRRVKEIRVQMDGGATVQSRVVSSRQLRSPIQVSKK